jgi:hypothetical protein
MRLFTTITRFWVSAARVATTKIIEVFLNNGSFIAKPLPIFLLLGLAPAFFLLRLAFGLFVVPIQPMIDEVQTCLLGLKYYATNTWPYYGNDLITPPDNLILQSQDPGALEGLLIGLPLRLWPNPLAPFVLMNLLSMAGLCFLGHYVRKRLPALPAWFVYPWLLTAPWCVHFSTSMMNISFTLPLSCLFFVAWMESIPELGLGWISLPLANALMGFAFSGWIQLHRNFVLLAPFFLITLLSQLKHSRKLDGLFYFLIGVLPLSLLLIPTLLQNNFHLSRDVHSYSYTFNWHNLKMFFTTLVQFFAMASFEMPRFIGAHTHQRMLYLAGNIFLWPGFFLWYFGFVQVLTLIGFHFVRKNSHKEWKWIVWLSAGTFGWVFFVLLFTQKDPNVNTFYEMIPIPLIYSLYVWERVWNYRWGKLGLPVFLGAALIFQIGYVLDRVPLKESLYSMYQDQLSAAVDQKNYHRLGERRPGALY